MAPILEKITKLREQRGWSEYMLAEKAEMTQSTISSWYGKDMIPTVPSLERVCRAFGISLSQFFAEEGEPVVLDPQQEKLLEWFSTLSPQKREKFLAFIASIDRRALQAKSVSPKGPRWLEGLFCHYKKPMVS